MANKNNKFVWLEIISLLSHAIMTREPITQQKQVSSEILAAFRYAMLSKIIFAQYSF